MGNLYERMHARGELLLCGQHTVHAGDLVEAAAQRWGAPSLVASDRWREADLREALAAAGLYPDLVLRGQGFKDGAEDVRGFRKAVLDGQVQVEPSLLLSSALTEARAVSDTAGNANVGDVYV